MTTKRDGFDVCPFDPVSALWSTQLEHWGIVRWWVGAPPHTEQRLVCGWQGKAGKKTAALTGQPPWEPPREPRWPMHSDQHLHKAGGMRSEPRVSGDCVLFFWTVLHKTTAKGGQGAHSLTSTVVLLLQEAEDVVADVEHDAAVGHVLHGKRKGEGAGEPGRLGEGGTRGALSCGTNPAEAEGLAELAHGLRAVAEPPNDLDDDAAAGTELRVHLQTRAPEEHGGVENWAGVSVFGRKWNKQQPTWRMTVCVLVKPSFLMAASISWWPLAGASFLSPSTPWLNTDCTWS